MKVYRMLLMVVGTLGLAACGGAPGTAASPSQPPAATSAPTGAPTAAPAPTGAAQPTTEAGDVLVVYHKTGGIMGLDETLTIAADGSLSLKERDGSQQAGRADARQLQELKTLLDAQAFAGLAASYQASGADMFIYEIRVPARSQVVTTMDGAEHPTVLGQAIAVLEALRAQLR